MNDNETVKKVIADLESLAERLYEYEWAYEDERLAVHFAIGYLSVGR